MIEQRRLAPPQDTIDAELLIQFAENGSSRIKRTGRAPAVYPLAQPD
jgi:hypothetical protein